jgi:uncharacterized protein (DUF2141 family)
MIRTLLVLALLVLSASAALASKITVTIEGVHSDRGQVTVGLFSRAEGFPDGDYADKWIRVPAKTQPITVVFDDLAPGRYAVGAYHDENGNGKLDTNFIGWPIEGYALSNGIRLSIFRPRFKDSAFTVDGEGASVTLHIGY